MTMMMMMMMIIIIIVITIVIIIISRDGELHQSLCIHVSKALQGNERGAMGSKNPPAY